MQTYVDIVLPAAVRKIFTYHIHSKEHSEELVGRRVWVPFRNYYAIGVIVEVHQNKPSFETRPIRKILDEKPVVDKQLLELTRWIHQFYYSSWGEVIQAALPSGLNFVSKKYVRRSSSFEGNISADEKDLIAEFIDEKEWSYSELVKRFKGTSGNRIFNQLLRKGVVEIWEEPELKTVQPTIRVWELCNGKSSVDIKTDSEKPRKWEQALLEFSKLDMPVRHTKLIQNKLFTKYTLSRLKKEGWIIDNWVTEDNIRKEVTLETVSPNPLNEEQKLVFQKMKPAIQDRRFANFLLYGITGSGKTEVYIHALSEIRGLGRGGIVLVPEIALTPQTVSRFQHIFGDQVAILHSRMTDRERLSEWKALESGRKHIAIGPRSAVFAPVQNLGLIILDEEHDASYKQEDPAPRYHAREVAIMRASLSKATVIMGSATPSMQVLSMVERGKAELMELSQRHGGAQLPEISIIDLKQYRNAMRGSLSVALFESIQESLSKNEQVILLYNRRGFGSYIQCDNCGHIPQSPECSVSLTYHKHRNILLDHYSGYSRKADTYCEKCGSKQLIIQGSGTQKIEEELEELFPEAKVLRFDKDSTSGKGAHERILKDFENQKADILLGTQLVAKGLNFPNVTTVGVIDADTEQAFPSFNSSERLYQLLSQVSGRSGRADKKGRVFIQTRQSDNPVIRFAKLHDHKGFAKEEMAFRRELKYPPYSRIIRFVLKAKNEQKVIQSAHRLKDAVEGIVPDLPILGPSPAAIGWMNKNYVWEIYLKIDVQKGAGYIQALMNLIMENYHHQADAGLSQVRVNINIDSIR